MKSTLDDKNFAVEFGRELKHHYDRATREGVNGVKLSDEQFASTLDVTRPALKKYLGGSAMPALRVVVLAFIQYGINVPYFGTPLFGKKGKKRESSPAITQLVLPFSVQGLNTAAIQT
ncbi:MAG: hypothetical protein WA826_20250, partial [Silvibacterium sp.]